MNKIKYITAVLIAVTGLCLQQAKADTFTSSLDIGNSAIAGDLLAGQEFGTVTVTVTGTTALITFTANTAGGFSFIDTSAAGVQLSQPPGSPLKVTDAAFKDFASGKNVDGFGVFNLTVNNLDGSGSAVSTISFDVTVASGTLAGNVLTTNLNGFDAVAHISFNGGVNTGFAGEAPGVSHIPDGGMTAMLLGLGLSGLGLVRRFVKR